MKKKPQIFNRIQAQGVSVDPKLVKALVSSKGAAMKNIVENWRDYMSEVFSQPQPTSRAPEIMGPKDDKQTASFKVDDQEFEIIITRIKPRQLMLYNLGFSRILDGKPVDIMTGVSREQVFRILATVVSWVKNWIRVNQDSAKAFLVGGNADDKSRIKLYETIIKRVISGSRFKYVRRDGEMAQPPGQPGIFFVVYDPLYMKENKKYAAMLDRDLSRLFGYGLDKEDKPPNPLDALMGKKPLNKTNESATILPTQKVGKVKFDPNGLGETPNTKDIDYFGFTVWMRASDFIKLNPPRGYPADYVANYFKNNPEVVIAPASISADWVNDHWEIYSHEGRGRMQEVIKMNPMAMVPVHVLPSRGLRARDLTEEMIFAKIYSDSRAKMPFKVKPKTAVWQGKLYKSPKDL